MFALAEARSKPADGFLRTAARVVQDGAEAARPVSGFGSTSSECARPPASLPIEQPISPLCHRKLGDITIGNQARDGSIGEDERRTAVDGMTANLTDEEIAAQPFDLYRQGYEYYWRTHAHPRSTFRYTMSSLLDLMRFDATDHIDLITQPLLMMAGTKADSLYMTEDAFPKATGTIDKEFFRIEGAKHIAACQVQKSRATISRAACPWNGPPTARTQGGTGQSSIQSRSEDRNRYH